MLKRFAFLLATSFAVLALLAACGGDDGDNGNGGGSGGNGDSITVEMTDDMKFSPSTITVSPGASVTIRAENKGSLVHDFTIDNLNGQKFQVVADGGETEEGTFTAPSSATTIEFHCAQPGHAQAGMKGTLEVK